jgi:dihydrofolate reductase
MSLDGYVIGPDPSPDQPLGRGGRQLQDWLHEGFGEREQELLDELKRTIGAVVMGRRSYDLLRSGQVEVDWPHVPLVVLTHRAGDDVGDRAVTFVNDLDSAVRVASDEVGADRFMAVHGAEVAQEFLAANLVDEVQIHLTPVTLGGGTRLFDGAAARPMNLQQTRIVESTSATHIRFTVAR